MGKSHVCHWNKGSRERKDAQGYFVNYARLMDSTLLGCYLSGQTVKTGGGTSIAKIGLENIAFFATRHEIYP
ncbi:hypothetical protein PAXRUDRAFT_822044 [Paxillus rubicundulus Ve08.2h10]|uniref:Uncharacterized protein n=1 Tax=Paxillus rubicundulus Ve08.2h10 TaxID=930991 RepID=A0A0D0ECW9_9AGAM|nr:hypothetical protein PAXRUDRAFT_822044 [Paxillus rubicundulus Ve08.2h10]